MGILEKIKEIEAEIARTQKNKATEGHLGLLKARLAKLRTQQQEGQASGGVRFWFLLFFVFSCSALSLELPRLK
eukprot:133951-Prorocentrum_lima.AAC.1